MWVWIAAIALLVVLFYGCALEGMSENGKEYVLEPDTNYSSGDVPNGNFPNSTVDQCTEKCNSDPTCKGYVFNTNDNKCWLKASFGTRSDFPGGQTYFKVPDNYTFEPGIDYGGNDKDGSKKATNPEACSAACSKDPACKGFVFDPRNKANNCWLKSAMGNRKELPGVNSYTMRPPEAVVPEATVPDPLPAGYTLFKADAQYEGKYTTAAATNLTDCMTACSGLPGCQGIGSNSTNDCRLYSEFSDLSAPLSGYNTYKYSAPLQPIDAPPAPEPAEPAPEPVAQSVPALQRFFKRKK